MIISEIIAELTYNNGAFPHQAVIEAIAQRESVTPKLLRILEDATTNIESIAGQENYMGHLYAMYLLAQFREQRAYQPLVNLVTSDWTYVEMTLGEIVTEDLGRMLASVCNGDISLICGMIENAEINEYVRSAGLDALIVLVAQGVKTRAELMAYFQNLFKGKLEREFDFVWGSLISHCCDIYAGEVAEDIEQAFADGLVDIGYISPDYVKRKLKSEGRAIEQLSKDPHNTFIDDAAHEMANWACFQEPIQPARISKRDQFWTLAPIRTGPKVGRNESCPCGSGKKYKKCCGSG